MKSIFLISIRIALRSIPKGRIDNKIALAQVKAWPKAGDEPLSELMLYRFTDAYMQH